INRLAAWVVGSRATLKALLQAFLSPINDLKKAELEGNYTMRLAVTEELKSYPFGAVWDYYCQESGVPVGTDWLKEVVQYENKFLLNR
ncbi:L-rhamnose isomerase, partial [Sporolactobacillus sp. CPB3-1]